MNLYIILLFMIIIIIRIVQFGIYIISNKILNKLEESKDIVGFIKRTWKNYSDYNPFI